MSGDASMSELSVRLAVAADRVMPDAKRKLAVIAQASVGAMKQSVKDYHAIDTGAMRNSVTAEPQGEWTYLIGPTVDYAAYVALGTSRMAARPFHLATAQQIGAFAKKAKLEVFDL